MIFNLRLTYPPRFLPFQNVVMYSFCMNCGDNLDPLIVQGKQFGTFPVKISMSCNLIMVLILDVISKYVTHV